MHHSFGYWCSSFPMMSMPVHSFLTIFPCLVFFLVYMVLMPAQPQFHMALSPHFVFSPISPPAHFMWHHSLSCIELYMLLSSSVHVVEPLNEEKRPLLLLSSPHSRRMLIACLI